ncbi:putative sporulation protein YtxC [Clostridium neuense]|uniref:Sporulation protein YtxC n=1 Tax=Clostridium neuense TaxID=1728934 RepID=A0ABW8TGN4_9CLOT
MLLETVVYDDKLDNIIKNINEIKYTFESSNVAIGISESVENDLHYVKIICSDKDYSEKIKSKFYIYFAEELYKYIAGDFCKNKLRELVKESYFFLNPDEIDDVCKKCSRIILNYETINDSNISYINMVNSIVNKIIECIKENDEININGFTTFRMKNIEKDFCNIIDKIIENYMVEKEYDEFIKLLKYFVDIQDSKIDELNIYVDREGKYMLRDMDGNNIENKMIDELCDVNVSGVNLDDVLISGLITLSPEKIIIHCRESFTNKEIIQTIMNVFENKVFFCDDCKMCKELKRNLIRQ